VRSLLLPLQMLVKQASPAAGGSRRRGGAASRRQREIAAALESVKDGSDLSLRELVPSLMAACDAYHEQDPLYLAFADRAVRLALTSCTDARAGVFSGMLLTLSAVVARTAGGDV
jgi:hypothetical protein